MGWQSFIIGPRTAGDAIAAEILGRANDPSTWTLANLGAIVFRVQRDTTDEFFFCPKASVALGTFIAARDAKDCNPPLVNTLSRPGSARLLLGFHTQWEPIKRSASGRWPARPSFWHLPPHGTAGSKPER